MNKTSVVATMRKRTRPHDGRYFVTAPDEPEFSTDHAGVAISLATTYACRSAYEEMTAYVRSVFGETVGRVEKRKDGVILAYMKQGEYVR